MFSCFTGLSYIDLKTLCKKNIKTIDGKTWIIKRREKTKNSFQIPLFEYPASIIKKYNENWNSLNQEDPLFTVISNQKINKNLKEIAQAARLDKNLTFHVAKHFAGITGQGTAASPIRFWAGASFENRATAPYRVIQDGSVVMTKATVEGIINAISGYIGGFKIQQGQIGYGSSSEQDTTHGLALFRDFIRFYNGSQRVLLGCLNSLGYPFNGLMELTGNMGTTLELHHKYASTSDESLESWYKLKALSVFGNQYNLGKVAMFEKGYIGQAYTDIIETHIGITHKYLFTSTGTTTFLGIDLPTKSMIDKITGNVPVQFDIEIVCDRTMPNKIRVYSKEGAYVYDNNGSVITSNEKSKNGIDMAKGDVLRLRYYNGGWNRIFYIAVH